MSICGTAPTGSFPDGSRRPWKKQRRQENPEEYLALALRDDVRDNSPMQTESSMYSDLLNWAIGKIEFYELARLLLEK
jgi:hypothetical protein